MNHYTKQDILRLAEEEDIEFIRLQFTDVFGTLKNIAITNPSFQRRWKTSVCLTALRSGDLQKPNSRTCICILIWTRLPYFRGGRSRARWQG